MHYGISGQKKEGKVSVINALWDLWAKIEGKVSVIHDHQLLCSLYFLLP